MAIYRIFDNGEQVNRIVAGAAFVTSFCDEQGYTWELEPEAEAEPEYSEADDTAAMLVDHEYRLTLLELGLTE